MAKTILDKEDAVKKARCDLEAKRNKLEDEKSQQEPSDPESTTSSLTVSSGFAVSRINKSAHKEDTQETAEPIVSLSNYGDDTPNKKRRLDCHDSNVSTSSNSGEDTQQQDLAVNAFSTDRTTSSMSDLTESKKGSYRGGESNAIQPQNESVPCLKSSASVSSDAAVAKETSYPEAHDLGHKDVVINDRKRKVPSVGVNFDVDYEEVFLKSNIPQILASISGRIVAWNDFFVRATGLSNELIDRLTLFSLVQTDSLSNLFSLVSRSLQAPAAAMIASNNGDATSDQEKVSLSKYLTMTLPCKDFEANKCSSGRTLHMTVSGFTN